MKQFKNDEAMAEMETLLKKIEDPSADITKMSDEIKRVTELTRLCRNYIKGKEEEVDKIVNEE